MNGIITWTLNLPSWAWILGGIVGGTAGLYILLVLGAEHQDGDAGQHIRAEMQKAAFDIDRALAVPCDPCNGRPGTCRCTAKAHCPNPLCGAADTTISDSGFHAELFAMLDKEMPQ